MMNYHKAFFIFIYTVSVHSQSHQPEDNIDYSQVYGTFADNFLWGTATSAYQVEGAWNADGKSPSIWDTESHVQPSVIADKSTGDVACNSYYQWSSDLDAMQRMGVQSYRMSISWTRILSKSSPGPINNAGVKYYNTLFDALLARNITPMVTLFHWDLPQYLQDNGGWLNIDTADAFYYYADACFSNFGSKVKFWLTMNDPASFLIQAYGQGFFEPTVPVDHAGIYRANKVVLLAHTNAYRLYEQKYKATQNGQVGIALGLTDYRPATSNPNDVAANERARTWNGGVYLEPIVKTGDWPELMKNVTAWRYGSTNITNPLPIMHVHEQQHIKGTYDFFAINLYTSSLISAADTKVVPANYYNDIMATQSMDPNWPISASDWLAYVPSSMLRSLKWLQAWDKDATIYITENGWSTSPDDPHNLDDQMRIKYYRNYIGAALYGYKNASINLGGYTLWSLEDNFEWRDGYSKRFGIHYIDFDNDAELQRIPRTSVSFYAQTIANNGFVRSNTTMTTTPKCTTKTTSTPNPMSSTISTSCSCGQLEFSGDAGVIRSPNYPNNYCNNLDCLYVFDVPIGYIVQARFVGVLEPSNNYDNADYLTIIQTECPAVIDLPLYDSFDRTFYNPDNHFEFQFHTNGSGTAMGWQVTITAIPDPKTANKFDVFNKFADLYRHKPLTPPIFNYPILGSHMSRKNQIMKAAVADQNTTFSIEDCGIQNYFGKNGIIQLPSYGKSYKNNMMCSYRITVEEGYIVQIRLYGTTADDIDGIYVFENFCIYYDLVFLTGEIDSAYHSMDNVLGFVWSTNEYGNDATGFTAVWEAIKAAPAPPAPVPLIPAQSDNCPCNNRKIYYNEGVATSPRWPNNYCNNLNCPYNVQTYNDSYAKIHVIGNTWQGFDFLTCNNIQSDDGSTSRTFTGYFATSLLARNNTIQCIFTSDNVATRSGFNFLFQPCYNRNGTMICSLHDNEAEALLRSGDIAKIERALDEGRRRLKHQLL